MVQDRRLIDDIKRHFSEKSSDELRAIIETQDSDRWSPPAFIAAREVLDDRRDGKASEPLIQTLAVEISQELEINNVTSTDTAPQVVRLNRDEEPALGFKNDLIILGRRFLLCVIWACRTVWYWLLAFFVVIPIVLVSGIDGNSDAATVFFYTVVGLCVVLAWFVTFIKMDS